MPWLWTQSLSAVFTLPFPLCLKSTPASVVRTLRMAFRAHPGLSRIISVSLIIPVKTLFPNKDSIRGSGNSDVGVPLGVGAPFQFTTPFIACKCPHHIWECIRGTPSQSQGRLEQLLSAQATACFDVQWLNRLVLISSWYFVTMGDSLEEKQLVPTEF